MASGLTAAEARRRVAAVGPNTIETSARRPLAYALLAQLTSPLVLVLLGACVVSIIAGESADAIAIGAILILNAAVGAFQEHRAERAISALAAMTAPRARVLRDDRTQDIAAAEVVPGDLLLLEAGDVVAADARLIEAHRLATQESALTGESAQVDKSSMPVPTDAPLAERRDHVFMGTAVATGKGIAEVVATGMRTELGRVAALLGTVKREATPLQVRLARLGRTLTLLFVGLTFIVALLGLARGEEAGVVLVGAIALAVAAVPEGLPTIVTIALSLGVRRMAERNVLVRRLSAAETLGCTSVICSDKTGTLTTGVMTVREMWGPDLHRLLDAAAACCDATLNEDGPDGIGDTTELAILAAAAAHGIDRADIERERPRTSEVPFDAERRRMAIGRRDGVLYVKGAVESVLACASSGRDGVTAAAAELAAAGLRVLAVAVGRGDTEADLHIVGLLGLADPPRSECVEAVATAHRAGIDVVMITGDHPATARAIAHELGIIGGQRLAADHVYARATPEDKLRIVRAWKERGAVVAMTGDGVNDAPALREAHIGIAMGKSGTEVARGASDMVLADDNFASIVAAVREGRSIFSNIRKALEYLLTGNIAELAIVLGAVALGLPMPFVPLQLLWINLVTDGLPALALVADPVEAGTLSRPPRSRDEPILGWPEWRRIGVMGALEAALLLSFYAWCLETRDEVSARGLLFSALIISELLRALSARSAVASFWEVGAFTNLRLLAVIGGSLLAQLLLYYIPATQALFNLRPPSLGEIGLALCVGLVPVSAIETTKLVRRARRARETRRKAQARAGA